jgi:hypothetical protein
MEKKMCDLWEQYELLYNLNHKDYRDTEKRKEALEEIADFFGVTG